MVELSFATAGQEAARSVPGWQRSEWSVAEWPTAEWRGEDSAGALQPRVSARPLLIRPLVLSAASKPGRPGVSFKRGA